MHASAKIVGLMVLASMASWASLAQAQPVKVEIRGELGSYQLYRGGKPYQVFGAGTQAPEDFASLKAQGGNSVRTWSTGDGSMLDEAHSLGMTVALCLDVARERHGFDYSDEQAVQRQFETMREEVLKYRNHPALLVWLIGNELNHDYKNPKVYDAVNDISKMIHELDPNHPVSTITAGFSVPLARVIKERAPDLDFISVQYYGGLASLPRLLKRADIRKPVMVTEWGTVGHWEVGKTDWGAPIEFDSRKKADFFEKSYKDVLVPLAGRTIGDYVFLWGHKQERTPTWYGVFTPEGERTPAVDVMKQVWTGEPPADPAPRLVKLGLAGKSANDNVRLTAGESVQAKVTATDKGKGKLTYRWQLLAESTATQSGGDAEEMPEDFSRLIPDSAGASARFNLPQAPGAYRLFVYVVDASNGAAHANIPFYVEAPK